MLIREDVVTKATPERTWELIADPTIHALWNPRIVDTQVLSSGPPCVGYRYRVTYELSGRRSEFDAEITGFTAPSQYVARLEERLKGDGSNFSRYMVETYTVARRGERTCVNHEVRIHHPGINIFLRPLIWLIMRTGRPTGKPFMEGFAELAEGKPRAAMRSR